ncbi:GntR family transcriptional regulator [Xinfangfangia sp. CPCC 101601]|uniref:GntR family transcriptional regulator n=1 Tax=Pseudogemmobacter lacusdianii TaxID=3069608 RepID=A0ABU0W181_9RHOB|nr:GntR family transcriptional regulator [Xinfangfangia sp. CPCC 101601]MDQ2067742.1 GntR family transcriptional regulator [Xinfangfangia sp. CPCC 101601]
MVKLSIVERRSSVDAVVDQLRQGVIHGHMQPGERITEMELSAALGIGRSTVRTALLELEKDELVVRKPYSAWAVADISPIKIWEIYTLRGALEELAIKLATESLTEEGRAKLAEAFDLLDKVQRKGLTEQRTDADLNFHRTIVQLSNHKKLIKTYESLLLQVEWVYRWSERQRPTSIHLSDWHRPIYDGILSGDPAAAVAANLNNYAVTLELDKQQATVAEETGL